MSDISCPKCGHTALSIATRCPQCGHPFESRLWQSPVSAEGRRRVPARLVIAGVVIVLVVVGVAQRQSRGPVSYLPARRAAGSTASAPATPPAAVQPADPSPPADSALPPDPTPAVAQVETEPATATAPPPATVEPSSDDSSLERRYASTWVNVREGRSGSTPVVQVLKPGEAVSVDSLRQGWYRVLNGGTPLGYVDRSLVGQDPESVSP